MLSIERAACRYSGCGLTLLTRCLRSSNRTTSAAVEDSDGDTTVSVHTATCLDKYTSGTYLRCVDKVSLGVDVGTSSTKAVLVRGDGAVLAVATVAHDVTTPHAGQFEHDAERDWWGGFLAATTQVLQAAPSRVVVESIGLSACGPCLVAVDAAGDPLRPAILYGVDTRATQQVIDLEAQVGEAAVSERFGMPLSSQTVGPKINWMAEHEPALFAQTHTFLTTNGFLALRLTGRRAMDHHQAAYFAPYYANGDWDRTFDESGVVERLPKLLWSGDVVGKLTASAAAAGGLREGVPVVIGSSDGLTGAIGAGGRPDGTAVLNYGTTLGLTVLTSKDTKVGGVWRTPGAFAGELCVVGALSTAGALTSWFRDLLAGGPDTPDGAAEVFTLLADEAAASPAGSAGLLLLPYFSGERTPFYDPEAAGVLLGLRLDHTRGDLYRALLEGTAYGVRHLVAEMTNVGADVVNLRIVGGASSVPVWVQTISDVTGLRQEAVLPSHGAPIGAAFLASLAAGVAPNRAAINTWVSVDRAYEPNTGVRALHDARFQAYLEAYASSRPVLAELRRAQRLAP